VGSASPTYGLQDILRFNWEILYNSHWYPIAVFIQVN